MSDTHSDLPLSSTLKDIYKMQLQSIDDNANAHTQKTQRETVKKSVDFFQNLLF